MEMAIAGKGAGGGMSPATAQRLNGASSGSGFALALIFQPFAWPCSGSDARSLSSRASPTTSCRCKTGTTCVAGRGKRLVALTFFVVMLISIVAAYLYGVFFVNAIAPDTSAYPSLPFVAATS
jgi:hypothetical protein